MERQNGTSSSKPRAVLGILAALTGALAACGVRPTAPAAAASELERAFVAVYGAPPPVSEAAPECQDAVLTPHSLMAVADRFVLIVVGERSRGSRTCYGTAAIHYLRRTSDGYERVGSWPNLGGMDWGKPTEFRVRYDLFTHPALERVGGGDVMGSTKVTVALVELTPERPLQRLQLHTFISSDASSFRSEACGFEATIYPVERDRSLAVEYKWDDGRKEDVRMIRHGETYRPTEAGKSLPDTCYQK